MGRPPGDGERLLTVEEFVQLPEDPYWRHELVRGRVVREPPPASVHGWLSARLVRLLDEFVEAHSLGVVLTGSGTILARHPDTVRGPDLAFYSAGRIPASRYATPTYWGPPDLVVEVLSPSDRAAKIKEKVEDYLAAGVRVVWVVAPPKRKVVVHRAGDTRVFAGDAVLEADDVLPGFRLRLQQFFAL